MADVLIRVQAAAKKRILFLPHAIRQMSHPDRMITPEEVETVVLGGEMIEDYPTDPRGHSCLLLGFCAKALPVHVVCSPKDDYVAIITAYRPDPELWSGDFKRRL
ncbi:MAG TPA: DUF4258 domain-containing protein [Thermoanaerobaculia bacterium]|nr:DUF4258 domain-containing protein [Thermoanaerobaculia bacterium]